MRRSKAFSLIELMISIFLLMIVLGLIIKLVTSGRSAMEKPAAALQIQQDLLAGQKMLQRDLKETRTSTIRIYPNPEFPNEPPGISMISPRSIDTDELQTTSFGTPFWQKTVYYTLVSDPDRPGSGILVRKEGQVAGLPSAKLVTSNEKPSNANVVSARTRNVAHFIMLPKQKVPDLGLDLGNYGGFEAYFSDAEGNKSIEFSQRHPLVIVNFTAREISPRTGKETVLRYQVRACPGKQ